MKNDSSKNQFLLFDQEATPHEKESRDFLMRQFCKLGEMMGDGLHHESDGKWIVKEYNAIAKSLFPEMKNMQKKRRQDRSKQIDEQMIKLLLNNKCDCGGELVQSRSGSKVCYCVKCNSRYKFSKKKKK